MKKKNIFLLILIGLGLRLVLIFLRVHPAGDEIWALYLAQSTLKQIWFATLSDLHGPFYFLLLHLLRLLTPIPLSIIYLRLVSLFFGIFACFGTWYLSIQVAGKKVGLISFILSLFLPAFIWPAVFARYYSLLIVLVIISMVLFIGFCKTGKKSSLIWLIVVLTLGIYTHYYFSLLELSFTVYLLLNVHTRKHLIDWISSQIIVLLLFTPGLYYLLTLPKPELIGRHANSILKIPSLLITNIISSETLIFLYYFRNPWIYMPILGGLFVVTGILLINVFRYWRSELSKLLISILIIPPIVLILFAYIVQPLFSLGSLQIFIPALVIILAKSIELDLKKTKIFTFAFILCAGLSLYFLFDTSKIYGGPRKDFTYFYKNYHKGDFVLHSHLGSYLLGSYYSSKSANFEIIPSGSVTPATAIGVGYKHIMLEEIRSRAPRGVWYFESPYIDKKESDQVKSHMESRLTKVHEERFTDANSAISETYFNVYYYQ